IKESFRGETDLFGRISATYVAGFAAKTAVIVARDLLSNSTGAGYVKTFIQAAAQLELEPAQPTEAMLQGYEIEVTSSDDWLTADGKSEAKITAKVTLNGRPVEGHTVRFGVTSGTGSIRAVKDKTGKDGIARAIYTAGKKIGIAVVTATDTTVGITGSVQIELRSDAPAKIKIGIKPEKLPADGRSTADLTVLVTDINDNPNDNTEVEYRIASGGGELREERTVTDKDGETKNEYEAGRSPGTVTFELTVRSAVPTDEELAKARDLALAVTDYRFY
ncbi:MAG TPA: invasin domain 3-containing protein, partial [Candidatus Methanoperedens sp.]|nr:invasin domain 3-containing protein [Candidatus Methanoperedens sp.]